jgi:hypothetical protein
MRSLLALLIFATLTVRAQTFTTNTIYSLEISDFPGGLVGIPCANNKQKPHSKVLWRNSGTNNGFGGTNKLGFFFPDAGTNYFIAIYGSNTPTVIRFDGNEGFSGCTNNGHITFTDPFFYPSEGFTFGLYLTNQLPTNVAVPLTVINLAVDPNNLTNGP